MNTPSAIQRMAERFRTPQHSEFGPVPIWWWSGDTVTRERLRWQMEQLTSQGVFQAVIMNLAPSGPLYGALADDPAFMSEEWWEVFLGACQDAHELGFRFWPYDQIGFSGANFQGRLVTSRPEWAGRKLGRVAIDLRGELPQTVSIPPNAQALAAYVVTAGGSSAVSVPLENGRATWAGDGDTLAIVYAQEHGFDYFQPEAVAALLDTVHGEFKRRASEWFGNVIVGFFQDELPSMPTWGSQFAVRFSAENGYDVTTALGALWGDPIPTTIVTPDRARLDYQRVRTTLSREGFFDQLDRWFAENNLQCGFDQQSPAREGDPAGSVGVYADYLKTHSGFSAPGSDHLGDPKLHSSIAHLAGGTRTWIEAFHSSGWGGTLEETYDWLAPFLKRGATLYDPHAVYYSTPGGWWEWAPPSTCWRQPYWPEYHVLSDSVTRLSEVLSRGQLVADTALVYPTATVQAGFTFAGPTAAAETASRVYHAINGETAWSSEKPGVLDRLAHEYEIVDDGLLPTARIEDGQLMIGQAAFRNIVLPATTVLDDAAAATLAEFAEAGGVVIAVEHMPQTFDGEGAQRLRTAIETGRIVQVATPDAIADKLERSTPWVETDVPSLLRVVDDVHILALFAHDDLTGTEQPIYKGVEGYLDWIERGWGTFWEGLRETGYTFRAVGDRKSTVTVHGLDSRSVQRWNPVTGERTSLVVEAGADGATFEVDYRDGSIALLVLGDDLPEADGVTSRHRALGKPETIQDWHATATSTLDNRWGDFAGRGRGDSVPVEVWTFETAEGETVDGRTDWRPAVATFGPFAEVAGPIAHGPISDGAWTLAEWSLSRGIRNDGMHQDNLGPKGYVPEEFLYWKDIKVGEVVAARTWIDVPDGDHTLVVGVNADLEARLDGIPIQGIRRGGYWSYASVPHGRHQLELAFYATAREAIRASFAIVSEPDAYRRAEWLATTDVARAASVVSVKTTFQLTSLPEDRRIQVGAEQPCTVFVNGVEVGRQNAFHPYGGHREARFHPYDLSDHLVLGTNTLELRSIDSDRPVAGVVDAIPARFGGLGILSGSGEWTATRDGKPIELASRAQQWGDPRLLSLVPRPHPLPRASWLERPPYPTGVVVDLIPDADPGSREPRWLRCTLPIGATTITVPTDISFEARIDGEAVAVEESAIRLAQPAAYDTTLVLRFDPRDGRRGGALLDEPLQVITEEAPAPLADWKELGLESLAGEVRYRSTLPPLSAAPGERIQLDLGTVRGSVRVLIDGAPIATFAWGPYVVDITENYRENGTIEILIHNTLAGYLDVASPTPGVFPGQKIAGLFGPVTIVPTRDAAA